MVRGAHTHARTHTHTPFPYVTQVYITEYEKMKKRAARAVAANPADAETQVLGPKVGTGLRTVCICFGG